MISSDEIVLICSRADVVLASRSAAHVPSVCWGMGLNVDGPGRKITVWVDHAQALQFLADVQQTACIAAAFADPFSCRSLQVKGCDARVRKVLPGDARRLQEHLGMLIGELEKVGFNALKTSTMFGKPLAGLSAIEFTPAGWFEQTPGPSAGEALWSQP